MNFLFKIGFLIFSLVALVLVILFTKYAPDFYNLVGYFFMEEPPNLLTLGPILNNTLLIDFFNSFILLSGNVKIPEYILLLCILYAFVFSFKYIFLLSTNKSVMPSIWMFIASFLAFDCNQMRYSFALTLLVMSIYYQKKNLLVFSFMSHITMVAYKILSTRFIVIPLVLLFPIIVFFKTSRYAGLFDESGFIFYKSYLLLVPIVFFNLLSNKEIPLNSFINNLSLKLYFGFPILAILVPMMAARVVETLFVLLFYSNNLYQTSLFVRCLMYLFAVLMVTSRLTNGIPPVSETWLDEFGIFL